MRHERPELEEALGRLVTGLAADRRQLGDLEDKVLRLLRDSKGNILDDEQLVATLNNAKVTSGVCVWRGGAGGCWTWLAGVAGRCTPWLDCTFSVC